MTLEELAGGVPDDCYVLPTPFARSEELRIYWVMRKNNFMKDLREGVVLERRNRAIFVPHTEFPVFSDVLSGIVRRGKLS